MIPGFVVDLLVGLAVGLLKTFLARSDLIKRGEDHVIIEQAGLRDTAWRWVEQQARVDPGAAAKLRVLAGGGQLSDFVPDPDPPR